MIWEEETPVYGDVIRTRIRFYYHYGIYVSDERVIQFGLPDNRGIPNEQIAVLHTDIRTFLAGGSLEVGKADREERRSLHTPAQTVSRAESRLGETGYNILHNNCEHFVYDCALGQPKAGWLEDARAKLRQKLGKE